MEHHIYRVETLLVKSNLILNNVGEFRVCSCPYVDNLVVPFIVGYKTHVERRHDVLNLLVTILDKGLFLLRHKNVGQVK